MREIIKAFFMVFFGYMSFTFYKGSIEYNLQHLAFSSGLFAAVTLWALSDLITWLFRIIKGKVKDGIKRAVKRN